MKKITLICSGGMSTSLMVSKMEAAAKKDGIEIEIRATAESKFEEYEDDTDILLLGPQIGFMLDKYKELYKDKKMKIDVIDSIDYGMMNGEKVLKKALAM